MWILPQCHSKSMFARNFQFLNPLPPVPSCSFYMYPIPLNPQHTFALVSYPPPPPPLPPLPSQKKFCNAYDAYFEEKKSQDEK